MLKLRLYIKEVYNEMLTKVSWPTWKELQGSAIVVMISSLIIAIIIYIMDLSFGNLMKLIYSLFY